MLTFGQSKQREFTMPNRPSSLQQAVKITITLTLTLALVLITANCGIRRSNLLDYPEQPGVTIKTPPEGKSQIIFLRPSTHGHAISAVIYDNDSFVSVVMAKTCNIYLTDPGEHQLMVVSEAADFLMADLEAGKSYVVLVTPRMGAWRARFSLEGLSPESDKWANLEQWISEAYLVKLNDAGDQWPLDNVLSVAEVKEEYFPKWQAKENKPSLRKEDGVTDF